jgi:isocitrate lyase
MRDFAEAGAAAVHLEDQLSSMKKCGHMGGKVLVPPSEFIHKLVATRFAFDALDLPTVVIARTDADSATLLRADLDEADRPFLTGKRTVEGYFEIHGGVEHAIVRAIEYAPYADMLWCETSTPDLDEARRFAEGVHARFPGKPLAYNCSPSFNWRKYLGETELATFQERLGDMGYKFQFVTLAGFHALNASMFELARSYAKEGMAAYSRLQQHEFELERESGYEAVKHQSFVGAGYFDALQVLFGGGQASTVAMAGSTEEAQF